MLWNCTVDPEANGNLSQDTAVTCGRRELVYAFWETYVHSLNDEYEMNE